jgi:hypothetical protein
MRILILSPQPWNDLYISKHHYALELSEQHEVFFCSPAVVGKKSIYVKSIPTHPNLNIVELKFPISTFIKFKLRGLYKKIYAWYFKKTVLKVIRDIHLIIDFGCYQQFDSISWMPAEKKVYFPVDDHHFLQPTSRGADFVFSVSSIICNKFQAGGVNCHFINHGLSKYFPIDLNPSSQCKFEVNDNHEYVKKIRVGYSGNLLIPFLDRPVFNKIIENNTEIDFHIYGNHKANPAIKEDNIWIDWLKTKPNVYLHGFVHPTELAKELAKMDFFLLCYKPDYKNYHGENSHKIFEYLSTGKVLLTSYLSLYEGSNLIEMTPKDQNEKLIDRFTEVASNLKKLNNDHLMQQRKLMALDNTYAKQIERMFEKIQ